MKTVKVLAPIVAAGAWLILAPLAHAQDAVGVNAAIRNSVQTRSGTSGALRPAQLRGQVRLGDQFVTGANSQVQVLLRDRSTFTVGSNARMTVDRFVVGSGSGASVARGAFRFASGRTTRGSSSQAVTTPVASIGVRGTIVDGVVGPEARAILSQQPGAPGFTGDDETALLVVLRGPSGDAHTFDTPGGIDVEGGGKSISLETPGQALIVTNEGAFGPFFLSDEASDALVLLLVPPAGSGPDESDSQREFGAARASDDVGTFGDEWPSDPTVELEPTTEPDTRGQGGEGPTNPQDFPG